MKMVKLEEIFVLKEEETTDETVSSTTGSHAVGSFDPFGTRGDVIFGPQGGGDGVSGA